MVNWSDPNEVQQFRQSAVTNGYNPQQVDAYVSQHAQTPALTSAPQITPDQSQATPQPKTFLQSAEDWIPTGGAVLGGLAAGTLGLESGPGAILTAMAGSGIGQGAGKALENYIQGKSLDQGVVGNAAMGGLAGGVGEIVSPLIGKILSGFSDAAATGALKLTGKQLADQGGTKVISDLLEKFGVTGADAAGLDTAVSTAGKAYDAVANRTDIPLSQQALIDTVNKVKGNLVGTGDEALTTAAQEQWDGLEKELQSKVFPKYGITQGADGTLVADATKAPTLADGLAQKRAFDDVTTEAQFNADPAKWGVNREAGNILRSTINKSAALANEPGLAQQGIDLSNLKELSDLARGRAGANVNPLGFLNLIKMGGAGLLSSALGVGPLPGAVGEAALDQALKTPAVIAPLSKGLGAAATAASSPITNMLLKAGTSKLGNSLLNADENNSAVTGPNQINDNTENNKQNDITNVSHNGVDSSTPVTKMPDTLNPFGASLAQLYQAKETALAKNEQMKAANLDKMITDEQAYQTNKINVAQEQANNPAATLQNLIQLYGAGTNNSISIGNTNVNTPAGVAAKAKQQYKLLTDQGFANKVKNYHQFMGTMGALLNTAAANGNPTTSRNAQILESELPNEFSTEAEAQKFFQDAQKLLPSLNLNIYGSGAGQSLQPQGGGGLGDVKKAIPHKDDTGLGDVKNALPKYLYR